jgi:dipeptide transport system permease protein
MFDRAAELRRAADRQATLGFSSAILDAAALGFLGLGAQPRRPNGARCWRARRVHPERLVGRDLPPRDPRHVLAFNLTGDGLRDALDPKLKT